MSICFLTGMQMPKGVPVATVAIGNAANAGLLALRILASSDATLQQKMLDYQVRLACCLQPGWCVALRSIAFTVEYVRLPAGQCCLISVARLL